MAIQTEREREREFCECKLLSYKYAADLGRVFGGVPREVTRWELRKDGLEEWLIPLYIAIVMSALKWQKEVADLHYYLYWYECESTLGSVFLSAVCDNHGSYYSRTVERFACVSNIGSEWRELVRIENMVKWKSRVEVKDLKMNTKKTEIMYGCDKIVRME